MEGLRDRREHRWARGRLSAYVDDELELVGRRRLERHARGCPECRPMLRSLVVVVDALRRLPRPTRRSMAQPIILRLRAEEAPEDEHVPG